MNNLTLIETSQSLADSLAAYIEATYHISNERLVGMRRSLLDQTGVIRQVPYIESTPRYVSGRSFEQLDIPAAARDLLVLASTSLHDGQPLLHNPPYMHQAEALEEIVGRGRSAAITTGTGSGKTESFLLPILAFLACQATESPEAFAEPAVRSLLLYPMNALVNDQLGRLRILLGSDAIAGWFYAQVGRPVRFARYTSRTLYPGVRTRLKDQQRLRPLGKYFVDLARAVPGTPEGDRKVRLRVELSRRGKWPAKPDMVSWYGEEGARWQKGNGEYLRAVTLGSDSELLTRHEVLANPPDLLVTNYSMLEYMLMRPLERRIFDKTRDWYEANRNEAFVVVVDEAHLYRGSPGAEVALLLRRLRDRLGLQESQLRVIGTTASFANKEAAPRFLSKLSGLPEESFVSIKGTLVTNEPAGPGTAQDATVLASLDLDVFYGATETERRGLLGQILSIFGVTQPDPRVACFEALSRYAPMGLLINETMTQARPLEELGELLFPSASTMTANRAATVLVALGSYARPLTGLDGPGLLPARVHALFRGLPGLWACLDPDCLAIDVDLRNGPTGRLYSQPRTSCECGARVLELYTCRQCGTAYARGYVDNLDTPHFVWSTPGEALQAASGTIETLVAVDLLLEAPVRNNVRSVELDTRTGRLNMPRQSSSTRLVYMPVVVPDESVPGEFKPCAVCGQTAARGTTSVQDHQTSGDEPFQTIVAKQIEVQPQSEPATKFAPLAGRKVLVFSDSRQVAARLAPNLQKFTMRDAVRPCLLRGYSWLASQPMLPPFLTVNDAYLAVLIGSTELGVRLQPAARDTDTFEADRRRVAAFWEGPKGDPADTLALLVETRARSAPETLLDSIHNVLNHRYFGVRSLALASLALLKPQIVDDLPALQPTIDSGADKLAIVERWLASWPGAWMNGTPATWADDELRPTAGIYHTDLRSLFDPGAQKRFETVWLPVMLAELADSHGSQFRLRADRVALQLDGSWASCGVCRAVQRPLPSRPTLCTECGSNRLVVVDPNVDPVFVARKGFLRLPAVRALRDGVPPIALIAAEHTAQLNDAQADDIFSEAEENELLFQDVDLGLNKPAVDVLSCTTTMEVGIDIGALSGVALRNIPPGRANYQQRAGRAGRRGRAVATVTAFASTDSHDEHGFAHPDELIRGPVIDPEVTLDNWQIARRHLHAFVLQEYLLSRVGRNADPSKLGAQLFAVLGTVASFTGTVATLNLQDFAEWETSEEESLAKRATRWLPKELVSDLSLEEIRDRVRETVDAVSAALSSIEPTAGAGGTSDDEVLTEQPAEAEDASPERPEARETLLSRLLYRGVLPRYAFPTDVASFYVFNAEASTRFRPAFKYSPGQALAVALSQYAPGKRVWIGGREWTSGAVYSPYADDRFNAWVDRQLYLECQVCHFAVLEDYNPEHRSEQRACPACGSPDTLGPAQIWLRPPGFAHPVRESENTSPKDAPPPSYATSARLTASTPPDSSLWSTVNDRIRVHFDRMELLVTNRGPDEKGYTYCISCGLIEPATAPKSRVLGSHLKPFPDQREPQCVGDRVSKGIVLGTRFISDVLLVSLRTDSPVAIQPGLESTTVALRSLAEAMSLQASLMLGIGRSEVQAEFRPARTSGGPTGNEVEIYLYDTLAGGAGYARRLEGAARQWLEGTLDLLENCPEDCDASCYRCLRSFGNRFQHSQLDRNIAGTLLRYLLRSELVSNLKRLEKLHGMLADDIRSFDLPDLEVTTGDPIDVDGIGTVIAPLIVRRDGQAPRVVLVDYAVAPLTPMDSAWLDPSEFTVNPQIFRADELVVSRNLPFATKGLLTSLGYPT